MKGISPVQKWVISLRLFSLPFIFFSYILGVIFAFIQAGERPGLLLPALAFLPLLFNHLAANLLSDIQDYRKGIDTVPDKLSGGIVRGWVTEKEVVQVVIGLYLAASAIGIILIFYLGLVMAPMLLAGFLLGLFYSTGTRYAFKYTILGEWSIFAGYGMLSPA